MPSFTTSISDLKGLGPIVQVQIAISRALEDVLRQQEQSIASPVRAAAMIDTGAARTVIQQGLAGQLGLKPVGVAHMSTASSTDVECHIYAVRVLFPSRVIVETTALEAPLRDPHIQCLIGREILAHGVFIYLGYSNQFTLSF